MNSKLIAKYDVPVPRYTSYPTVPYWENNISTESWIGSVSETLKAENSNWSMYLHIPFCETLCTFCGCNTVITKDHSKESTYVDDVLREWSLYTETVPNLTKRPLKSLHLGGGSPSFLNAENLEKLMHPILNAVTVDQNEFEGSIEVDPRRTTSEQLSMLFSLGFKRISMGVQDFNSEVQRLVNRTQPFEITESLISTSRKLGYSSVNIDLIYGLAGQTSESFAKTIDLTCLLKPDRIALYSFALVPWIKPQHRLFKDEDLPTGDQKRALYELARTKLLEFGYYEIGMDHFALKTDGLYNAIQKNKLHRNFMGYTDVKTDLLLGLGVSSISESNDHFHQNEKLLPSYEKFVRSKTIPTFRGHRLNAEDQHNRNSILKLITQFRTNLNQEQISASRAFLAEMLNDNLIKIEGDIMSVTENGRPFIRNICAFFDSRMRAKNPGQRIFSSSI
jgi:oxygen-independent coproporphyrinogen-3 oxidase